MALTPKKFRKALKSFQLKEGLKTSTQIREVLLNDPAFLQNQRSKVKGKFYKRKLQKLVNKKVKHILQN